jgi:UDP-N-acetylglucosamine 2-epimerase (hydrolysing)
MNKRILFLTGTRADYGKLKPLISTLAGSFEVHIFVTGMHMLKVFGSTFLEVKKDGFKNVFLFVNQRTDDHLDQVLAKTISGFSDYIRETPPDMIIVHGDRVEALAGSIVGAMNNILVAHVEGGEVSGTIDESIRHAISKFAHIHFVSNTIAKTRLLQLGERESTIFVVGSPDHEIMGSCSLPDLAIAKDYYEISFDDFSIAILHPVTTELDRLEEDVQAFVEALTCSERNYVVIYPNNDPGFALILDAYQTLIDNPRFRLLPSVRFEYFLTLLKNAAFIIGNSSSGIREAPVFSTPTINLGSRQNARSNFSEIIHCDFTLDNVKQAIAEAEQLKPTPFSEFGRQDTSKLVLAALSDNSIWELDLQKSFVSV